MEKLTAFLLSKLAPSGLLQWMLGCEKKIKLDDLATVIFSSGSTANPRA
ncbi:MAG: hypothetical protein WDN00_14735 [Limisphaerales bacterium]